MVSNKEYIIEFRRIGDYIKVSAVDPVTYREISVPVHTSLKLSQQQMKEHAIKRLEYVLNKEKNNPKLF